MKKSFWMVFVFIWLLTGTGNASLAAASTAAVSTAAPSTASTAQAVGIGSASSVAAPEISAPSAILTEAESGQILYSKNIDQKLHISAACKLMTVLIAAENADFTSSVTVSSESVDAEGSALSLEVGAKYELGDLLYGIMLTSANDAAKAVAEHTAGSIGKFVEQMNATAAKLNMTSTHFTNPTGLYDETQYTTARDISLLIRYATGNSNFNRVFAVRARPWYGKDNSTTILTSPNKLFWSYDGVEGGKTGFNKKGQQTVICTASQENMRLISIVLDSPESDLFNSAAFLFDYGFQNFRKSTLVSKGDVLKTVTVDGSEINLVSQTDVSYVHPLGESYIKQFSATANMKPPIRKTIPVGSASYILQDGTTVAVSLYPESEQIPAEDFLTTAKKKMQENKDILVMILVLAALEVILIIVNLCKLVKKLTARIGSRRKGQPL